jgi:hypothetical protein
MSNPLLSTVIYYDDKAGALLGALKAHGAKQGSFIIE